MVAKISDEGHSFTACQPPHGWMDGWLTTTGLSCRASCIIKLSRGGKYVY